MSCGAQKAVNRFGLAAQKPTRHELTSPGPRLVDGDPPCHTRTALHACTAVRARRCCHSPALPCTWTWVLPISPTGFLRHAGAAGHGSSALRHRQAACPSPALRAPIRAVAPCPAVRPHLSGVSANKAHHRRHACMHTGAVTHGPIKPIRMRCAHDRAGAHVARGNGATRASPRPPADRVHPLRRIH